MAEATSNLQRDNVEHLFGLIRKFRNQEISVIYISHFLEEVREIADSFTVLRDGQSVATGEIRSVSDDRLIAHMVGRAIQNLFPSRVSATAQPHEKVFEAQALAAPPLLKDARFELRRGEILGVAGLMGSGRTQVVRTIFGLDQVTSGTINLAGKPVAASGGTPAVRLFKNIGYLSEDRKGERLDRWLPISH